MKTGRRTGIERILGIPWWVSVTLAVACYCTLSYLVPLLAPEGPLARLARAAPSFAPIITIALLLLAAKQLYDGVEPPREDDEERRDEE